MQRFLFIFLYIFYCFTAFATPKTDSLINELNNELNKKAFYDQNREASIKQFKTELKNTDPGNFNKKYRLCVAIYNRYKSYQFDSAYTYEKKLERLSLALNDKSKFYDSKVKLGFILLSAGMFKETFDSVREMKVGFLSDSARIDYYSMLTRAYYDLASFSNDNYYAPAYNRLANMYIDSAIALCKPNSYDYIYLRGYKSLKNGKIAQAKADFIDLMENHQLTEHQFAIVSSTLSTIYPKKDPSGISIDLLARAAIADIRSSTKETVALFWLSEKLYRKGDIRDAYNYIQHAMDDAEFYGARQRKLQISTVLPIIAAEKLNNSEREKERFLAYLLSITLLAILIVIFLIILYKQLKKVKAKEKIIEETNAELAYMNEKLVEGTRIKEEYIGYFFNVISGYILKLEKLKRSVDMKLTVRKYDDIGIIIDAINIKKERENLFYTFDHVFLKIFPNFINEFNALFREEDQIWPRENEVLTTDLRIFALIRMGIEDNAAIANILEYSEKTIYVYKMRIKAKALIHGDEFEKRIMSIRAETEAKS